MEERMDSEMENKWIKLLFFASPRRYSLQKERMKGAKLRGVFCCCNRANFGRVKISARE